MNSRKIVLGIAVAMLGLLVASVGRIAIADTYQPTPSCSKPYKPYAFNSQWDVDNFNQDVERYKKCIKNFVEEQDQAVAVHKAAAAEAIATWNRFVKLELN